MEIKVSDGTTTSSGFDPEQFSKHDYEGVLDFLVDEGLNIAKDDEDDYLEEEEYDNIVITEITDLFNDYDNRHFLNKPLFEFLDWGWDIGIFEDEDILEKVIIIADRFGVDSIDEETLNHVTIYSDMTEWEVGEELFDEFGYECPDELRRYVDFDEWLEDIADVVELGYLRYAVIFEY